MPLLVGSSNWRRWTERATSPFVVLTEEQIIVVQRRVESRDVVSFPSSSEAFRFSPRSFARFIGDFRNAALNAA